MNIICISAMCVVATIICRLIDKFGKEYALSISLLASSFILVMVISAVTPAIDLVEELFELAGISYGFTDILFKGLGICYVTQLACDICRDNGENAMGASVELAGKAAMLVIALPLFSSLADIVRQLLQ